jgi:hypothetical protein
MRNWSNGLRVVAIGAAGLAVVVFLAGTTVVGQGTYQAPRSPYADGTPDLSGIWQAMNTANWNLEDHPMSEYHLSNWRLGALFGVPAGQSYVEGGTIPYTTAALATRKEKFEARLLADVYQPELGDPELKCYLPGTPRATYMPYPFQITQTSRFIHLKYTFANADRIVHMQDHRPSSVDTWMGWSNGSWDGDTLVIEVTGFHGYGWLDRAGNFIANGTKVTERYTRTGPDHMMYEVTLEDPEIYTRPWKIKMPLYRNVEPNAQILEYRCVELSEEALYGRLKKGGARPTDQP